MADLENETELLDYDETEEATAEVVADKKKDVKGSYVSIHSSGFRDFLLKECYLSFLWGSWVLPNKAFFI